MAQADKIRPEPINPSWKDSGFDSNLQRGQKTSNEPFVGGASFNTLLNEMLFNRMIKLKNLPSGTPPQGNDAGKIYWDKDNKKYKIWVDSTAQWCDVVFTSTSTTTTSSSSSSTSTTHT